MEITERQIRRIARQTFDQMARGGSIYARATGGGGGGTYDTTYKLNINGTTRGDGTNGVDLGTIYGAAAAGTGFLKGAVTNGVFTPSWDDTVLAYRGDLTDNYVNGTTYSTLPNGTYRHSLGGSTESVIHFQCGGSASGLDLLWQWNTGSSYPLKYRKQVDSSRFSSWVNLIDSENIGSQSVNYATSAGSAGSATSASVADTLGGYYASDFLKLAGGTMTGSLILNNSIYLHSKDNGGTARMIAGIDSNNNCCFGYGSAGAGCDTYLDGNRIYFRYGTNHSTAITLNEYGSLILQNTNDVQGSAWNNPALCIGGSYTGQHIEIDGNEIVAKTNATTTGPLYLGDTGSIIAIYDQCCIGGDNPGNEKLKVLGSIYTTVGLYSEGYVDQLSDQRYKDIIDYDAAPPLEVIAKAPAIHYRWNDRDDESVHVGSIAQYWKKAMPECVHKAGNGKLTMSYDVIAMLNTISLAREVMALRREIEKMRAA